MTNQRPKLWVNQVITPNSGVFELIVMEVTDPRDLRSSYLHKYLVARDGSYIYFEHRHHWTQKHFLVRKTDTHYKYDIVFIDSEVQ